MIAGLLYLWLPIACALLVAELWWCSFIAASPVAWRRLVWLAVCCALWPLAIVYGVTCLIAPALERALERVIDRMIKDLWP